MSWVWFVAAVWVAFSAGLIAGFLLCRGAEDDLDDDWQWPSAGTVSNAVSSTGATWTVNTSNTEGWDPPAASVVTPLRPPPNKPGGGVRLRVVE